MLNFIFSENLMWLIIAAIHLVNLIHFANKGNYKDGGWWAASAVLLVIIM